MLSVGHKSHGFTYLHGWAATRELRKNQKEKILSELHEKIDPGIVVLDFGWEKQTKQITELAKGGSWLFKSQPHIRFFSAHTCSSKTA